ncbi:hypothetical protein [Thermococcus sp.]
MENFKKISALAAGLIILMALFYFHFLNSDHGGEKPVVLPEDVMYSGYVGYAFVSPGTQIEFRFLWAEKTPSLGYSLHVRGVPEGINWSTEVFKTPCPSELKGMTCRHIYLLMTPEVPGKYNLSGVKLYITTNGSNLSAKVGNVSMVVEGSVFKNITTVYFPYAGSIFNRKLNPGDEVMYYVVLKNRGLENLTISGINMGGSFFTVEGLYYQEVPANASPQEITDIPNMSKAMKFPKEGLLLKPGKTVAIIVPLKARVNSRYAIIVPEIYVVDKGGTTHSVPGIPYYILGDG